MTRWVGTAVAAKILGVQPRSVIRYIEAGAIPPAAVRRNPGPRGHHQVDADQLRGFTRWLKENRTNRTAPRA